jgi:uncharacterized protein (DUF2235 family)
MTVTAAGEEGRMEKRVWLRSGSLTLLLVLLLVSTVAAQAEPLAPAAGARRLIVGLDGTLNSPEEGKQKKDAEHPYPYFLPTNVLKIFRAVQPLAADGVSQISYYSDGVGSFIDNPATPGKLDKLVDRFYGGLVGTGYESRVKSAYRFLVGNYHPHDQIFIFGFSRGAAEARTLAVFMDWAGGLLQKDDEYYIPELFLCWQQARGRPDAADEWFRKMKWVHRPQPAEVTFLGVFDTVISLGFRVAADFEEQDVPTVGPKFAFYVDRTPPPSVQTARQALAISEQRWDFRPQVWRSPAAGRPPGSLAQVWFPGAHSNVGGGYPRDALSHASLIWLLNEAHAAAGLDLDCSHLGDATIERADKIYNTDSGAYRIWEFLRGKAGLGVRSLDVGAAARIHIDASAGTRLHADSTWRPANLLSFLAAHREWIDDFDPSDRDCVREIVEAWNDQSQGRKPTPATPACASPTRAVPAPPAFCGPA